MSLETAGFIKDLVPTNPEGTDPKSQGDDHIRMLKAVLKAQFPGMTQGKGINLIEDNFNQLGGQGANYGVINIDSPVPYTCWLAINTGFTGTAPPNTGAADMVQNICWRTDRIYQIWYNSNAIWMRRWAGSSWNAWFNILGLGVGQTWQSFDASRALNTDYTNDTGRPISIGATATGTGAVRSQIRGVVNGIVVCSTTLSDLNNAGGVTGIEGSVVFTVPAGALYRVLVSQGTATLNLWRELR